MNLFELLRESHALQRRLCSRLMSARSTPAQRAAAFLQLKLELRAHAAAEERHLYVPLLMKDAGLKASRHALAEHHELEELCEALSVPDKGGSAWRQQAAELCRHVRHHLKEEESKFFQLAGRELSERQKDRLARSYQAELLAMRRKVAADYRSVVQHADGELAAA
ncbi:MAG: hemerythrin domain-containing protein [Rubrivivax sp.]|nr:hemerythrin domain-containing protein [Rubrivivax sp.]